MICPRCAHTMNDELAYCECCGTSLTAPTPKLRVVSTSTYRVDLYAEPEGNVIIPAAPQAAQGTAAFYDLYEPAPQPAMGINAAPNPAGVMRAPLNANASRKQRRSRKMQTLFSAGLISMLLLGFTGGMSAFALDDANSRMPLVVEYEEAVEPAADAASTAKEGTVTILDDPTPLAASPTSKNPAADYMVDAEPAPETSSAPAPLADTLGQAPAEAAPEPLAPCTIDINGTRVPYIHSVFAALCPDRNAALWAGSDDTTDGSYGYFIGHNPGDFACVYSLVPGNYVTLCDANGNLRNYTVTQLYDIPNTTVFEDLTAGIVPQGECLVMQTCIGDGSYYRIVVCQ